MNYKIVTNFWLSIIFPLVGAAITAVILKYVLDKSWFPYDVTISFAILVKVVEYLRDQTLRRKDKFDRLIILKKFAEDKIGLTRSIINKQNAASLVYCLSTLEFIVTHISKCCDHKSVQQDKFLKVKGMIANTKTTFGKAKFDPSITEPYSDVQLCIDKIDTYLNDL